ncbi:MAG: hypothetical protein UX85_C0001G0198 [Candidatus Beckwithbacteria bacterium GW2011_GWB1_47_15]|uniref:Uncharacterized protein n=1 Tax=Candidatus Beckwithbacteria bacterium GW2011_GWB1_47_15 TaxID=1618371 RepID=A0A0G1RXB6_9BACT|nr:MAG: hypothetical protein UY43_C0001G0927 [Candidatus Beckwithbacteria bacterium GW2011_GWC1_49_16]AQS30835.1 hypothetical protein [uncultured bacterium]KKU36020.1 MAG: hypothetical protein UX50_C0001G0197 [Candidatus Beckwithbacteria bacterium GW2011_GWA1_46_30]KKU61984.1 MAG: hypothetical protein UX85_C0001G0198 [Candidatus Beckwithbacteria bacterium GW2011_GWB1_47_15]KKU72462.1 MAG: hypothetical protein UX97_C0001G0332 [Candidatus Beckwithbacteria bacterium GW2011_GWA2_47_25]KKW04371.1 M
MRFKTYSKYWLKTSALTLQSLLATRLSSFLFLAGKFVRFFFFLAFLFVLKDRLGTIAGYSLDQVIIFFLVYNLFDLFGQFFYRGIYWFREEIVSGSFDFTLAKPLNPLFQILTAHTDFLDLPLLLVVIVALGWRLNSVSAPDLVSFAFLSLAAVIIVTAIHIAVAAVGVITTEVDHTIWIFRDLASMGRVPIDIYVESVRAFLTFVVPIALVFTFPAKALLGFLTPVTIAGVLAASVFIWWLSLKFWHYALTQYSSASS